MPPTLPAIAIHGGAGQIAPRRQDACVRACHTAAAAGLACLAAGGDALAAVQLAVRALEDDPELNAGIGAALTSEGKAELDAAIMCGATRRYGAVGAVPDLRRPIDAARAVLDDGEHCLLVGEAAWRFLAERGLERDLTGTLVTDRARAQLAAELARRQGTPPAPPPPGGGTVGAVAIDATGRLAAATSTGGISGKRPGRVGDSPLPGCGTWADLAGAASATGHGEAIMRTTLTRVAVDAIRGGATAQAAAAHALAELSTVLSASAGLITVDAAGRLGVAHTTPEMSWARATQGSPIEAGWRVA